MSIRNRLEEDLKQAMRGRESTRVTCIRMLKSKLQEREVAMRSEKGRDYRLEDEEVLSVISRYAKQRRDSIESYRQGGRDDLVASETAELAIVSEYLPKQLTEDELRTLVGEAIAESGASSAREMGSVMRLLAPRTKGLADGRLVSRLVKELLSG